MRALAPQSSSLLQLISLLVLPFAFLFQPASALAAVLPDTWCTNGTVETQVVHNQTLYVGGLFDMVGPPTGGAAVLDEGSGLLQSPYPHVAGVVHAVKPDGTGGWYLGGEFTSVQGVPRKNLAHIDAGGAVTPWNLGTNNFVWTIAIANGLVYVGGQFDSIAGQPRGGVAAIDQATGSLTPWNPTVTGLIPGASAPRVKSIACHGDKVYLGGSFTAVAGLPRGGFAEVDATTGIPTSWVVGSGQVTRMLLSGTNLYLGTGTNVSSNIRVFDVATRDSLSITAFAGGVTALVEDPGTGVIFVGGFFQQAGGQPRSNLAALAGPLGGVTGWNPGGSGVVICLAISSGNALLVGGSFSTLGGQPRHDMGSVDRTTGAVLPLAPNPGDTVRSIEVSGGKIFVGGVFTLMNGVERQNLAAFDVNTGQPTAWTSNTGGGGVYSLFLHGSTLYVGGGFTQLGGQARNRAGAFDLTTGTLTEWNPNVEGGRVLAMDVYEFFGTATVYLGGDFDQVGGFAGPRYLAGVDPNSGALTIWFFNVNGPVLALHRDRKMSPTAWLYIAGNFVLGLAAYDPVAGIQMPWNPNANGPVEDILPVTDAMGAVTKFYIAGSFSVVGGQERRGLAEVNINGAVTAWNPDVTGTVNDIELVGSSIYAGGSFTAVGGQPRYGLAAVNAVNGRVQSWSPKPSSFLSSFVRSVVSRGSFLHVGGSFTGVDDVNRGNIATISSIVTSVEAPGGAPGTFHTLRAAPNPFEWDTALHFSLTRREPVAISVYDVAGRLVRALHDGVLVPGSYRIPWDGRDGAGRLVGSGVYVLRLKSQSASVSSKVYRLK